MFVVCVCGSCVGVFGYVDISVHMWWRPEVDFVCPVLSLSDLLLGDRVSH